MVRLAAGLSFDHVGNADWAAEMARWASSSEADEEVQRGLWDEGEVIVKVVSVVTSRPLMRRGTVYEGSGVTGVEDWDDILCDDLY